MKIGNYTLHTIETGRFGLDGGAMFGVVPKPLWQKKISSDSQNRIPLHMRCLLLEGNGRLILIDNGLGEKYNQRFGEMYGVDPSFGTLGGSLHGAGFGFEEVTDVVLTHLHFDHCGGSTVRNKECFEVAFPNAVFHVQRSHLEWALAPNPREKASFLDENIQPLIASGQLNKIDGDIELFPGVDVMTVNGHTEAQQMVKISGEEGTLVFVADLLPTHAHLSLPWVMAYYVRPLISMSEKAIFLEQAAKNDWHLFFEHDPELQITRVKPDHRGRVNIFEPRHQLEW